VLEVRAEAHRTGAAGDSTIAELRSKGPACDGSDGTDLRENRCESGILIWCGGHAGICVGTQIHFSADEKRPSDVSWVSGTEPALDRRWTLNVPSPKIRTN
jgi:hypothetical protein